MAVTVKASADGVWVSTGSFTGTCTFTKPGTAASGDVLVAHLTGIGSSTISPPAGWTTVQQESTGGAASDVSAGVFYRVAGGSEPASYVFGTSASEVIGRLTVFTGADGAAPVNATTHNVGLAATTFPTALGITTTAASLVVALFGIRANGTRITATPPPGMTEIYERYDSSSVGLTQFADTQLFGPGMATGSLIASLSSAGEWAAALIALTVPNLPPNAPTLNLPDGVVLNKDATNRLPWTFSDPNPDDSQSKFDLQWWDLDGAGARIGSAHTVTQSIPNQFWDAAAATFTSGPKEWQVRTYDAAGVVGPFSASGFFTAAPAPSGPAITAPINGAAVSIAEMLTWSTPAQDAYQARRVADNAGTADAGTVYWDTGEVTDSTTRSLTVGFPINNRWEHVQVRVKDGGLWSTWADVRVDVSWTPPAEPGVALTSDAATASIAVAITNPAPGAGEPTASYNDVWLSAPSVPEFRAATLVPTNSTWTFWTPASGLTYTARVVSVASNGTTSETVTS